jgi:hypothetical protein
MLRVGDHDSEWAGLLLHRRPDACSYGYLVTLPFRGSALYLSLDSEQALPGVPIFRPTGGRSVPESLAV